MSKMKILLLGSTGLIGTAVSSVCGEKGIECIALSHSDVDITNNSLVTDVLTQHSPDAVINGAGLVGVNSCEDEPLKAFNINTIAVYHLARACEQMSITLVQPSTHSVFNGQKDDYYTEDDQPDPLNIYGASRLLSESAARRCGKHYIVRFPTLFGKRINGKVAFPDKVITWIREGRKFKISGDKIDSPSYGIDIARSTISLLDNQYPFGVYHIANNGKTNYYDFVLEMGRILNIKPGVTSVKEVEFEVKAPNALKTAMRSIKLKPLRSWQDALHEYITTEVK